MVCFILTRNGEHYLEVVEPGATDHAIMARLDSSRKDIGNAVSRSIDNVVDTLNAVDHTVAQLELE